MESSLGLTIEKIKQEEQNNEAKLKARRELETAKVIAERSIRDALTRVKKLQQDKIELLKKTDEFRSQVVIQNIRRDALSLQLNASKIQLEELNATAHQVFSEIQELRSSYCKSVQDVSDECDIWALLTKPSMELIPQTVKKVTENNEQTLMNEARLKNAIERRDKAIAERERLKSEPDTGEEFMRIRNALRYSLEMSANLRK